MKYLSLELKIKLFTNLPFCFFAIAFTSNIIAATRPVISKSVVCGIKIRLPCDDFLSSSKSNSSRFIQTLAYWGVGSGPYLVLPVLGPSNLRDLGGRFGDRPLNPISWQDEVGTTEMLISDGIQTRAQLLGMDPKSVGDPYVLMRSAYEQRRRYQINDGIVVDLFLDDPLLDDPSGAQ